MCFFGTLLAFLCTIVKKKIWTNDAFLYFPKFRIEEAEAQCALLNSEALCVSEFFSLFFYLGIIWYALDIQIVLHCIGVIKDLKHCYHHYDCR